MKRSERRILTTHTGSLPRSPEMQELLRLREGQYELDQATFNASTHQAVADVVQRQIATGLDVILDQVGGCGSPQPTCSGPEEATLGRPLSRPAR